MTNAQDINRQWLLISRPQGRVKLSDFEYRETPFEPPVLKDGQILVRNRLFSCAPTIRNWMNEPGRSYRTSVPLGTPVIGVVGAQVVASRHGDFPIGVLVNTVGRWEDYAVLDPGKAQVPVYRVPEDLSLADIMGPLSLNSLTAYFGLFHIGRPQAGENVVVSGAAGSVGSMVCQFAKLHGCRVIGIAGGTTKCDYLMRELGVDAAINYKDENVSQRLHGLCPNGVNLFFDNVGGDILQAVMDNIALHGRVVVCGQISAYDSSQPAPGPRDMMKVVYWRVRIQGFVLGDFADRIDEGRQAIRKWRDEGRLVWRQDVRHGFEELPAAFLDLFEGAHEGSLIVTADKDDDIRPIAEDRE